MLVISDILLKPICYKDIVLHSLKVTLAGTITIARYNQYITITDLVMDNFHYIMLFRVCDFRVLGQLPKPNHLLLIHFLCVLYHIARRSCHTLMSAANLGVCVGPSLLWSECPNVSDDLRIVPSIVECLITHCEFLCGSHVPSLLGDLRDSGTEESDCKYLEKFSFKISPKFSQNYFDFLTISRNSSKFSPHCFENFFKFIPLT